VTDHAFLLVFPFFGALSLTWDRPGRRAKGVLTTSRHRADCGLKNWGKMYVATI